MTLELICGAGDGYEEEDSILEGVGRSQAEEASKL
jgi:hypothetical protein